MNSRDLSARLAKFCLVAATATMAASPQQAFANGIQSGAQAQPSTATHTAPQTIAPQAINETYLQLRITHTLTAAVFAAYFADMDKTYRPTYLADKNYVLTFLNVWSQLIETGRFTSTEQIFAGIKASNGFLGQHFALWEGLTTDKGMPSINLFEYRNTALVVILKSESVKRPAHERMAELLDRLHSLLLASSKDHALMRGIAVAFLGSEHPKLDQRARDIIENIHPLKGLEFLNVFRDPLKTGRVAKTAERAIGLARQSLPTIRRAQGASTVSHGTPALNPIIERLAASGMRGGLVGSLGVHGAFAGVAAGASLGARDSAPKGSSQGESASTSSNQAARPAQKTPFAASLAYVWNFTQAMSPGLHSNDYQDFVPKIQTATAAQLAAQIHSALGGMKDGRAAKWIDYLKVFLQAEKIAKADGRPIDDPLALEYSFAHLHFLENLLINTLPMATSGKDKVEVLRQALLERDLKIYKRDQRVLTSVTLGWGGNCVSQTLLIVGMLKRLEHRFQYPDQMKLGIAVFTDHIEPVLYNEEKVTTLVYGKTFPRKGSIVYRPEYLLYSVLRDLKAEKPLRLAQFLDMPPHVLAERGKDEGGKGSDGEPTTWAGELSRRFVNEPPEETTMEFQNMSSAISDSVSKSSFPQAGANRSGGLMSLLGLSGLMSQSSQSAQPLKVVVDPDFAKSSTTMPFEFDFKNKTVKVKSDAMKLEISTLQSSLWQNPKGLAVAWLKVYEREVLRHPTFNRVSSTLDSIFNLSSIILELNDEDIQFLEQMMEPGSKETNLIRNYLGYLTQTDLCGPVISSATRFSMIGTMQFAARCAPATHSPWLQMLLGHMEKPLVLEQEIQSDIKRFVFLLHQATPIQREFLLSLVRSPQTRLLITAYLGAIKKVSLVSASKACVKNDVDLPSIESTDSSWFYVIPNSCTTAQKVTYDRNPQDGTQMLDQVLIELSHLTLAGFHLWTPQLVDALIKNQMGYEAQRHRALLLDLGKSVQLNDLDRTHPVLTPLKRFGFVRDRVSEPTGMPFEKVERDRKAGIVEGKSSRK